jgi:hypothetical protein
MLKTIGFLHAHHSNAGFFEAAASGPVRFLHFAEPGIAERLANDPAFDNRHARAKLSELIHWIADCGADALLVTCTEYCALLPDSDSFRIPVLRLDELFFGSLHAAGLPAHLLFTNPGTVEPTMAALRRWHADRNLEPDVSCSLIPDAFKLLMNGKRDAYLERLAEGIRTASAELSGDDKSRGTRMLAVAQLSMSGAGQAFERKTGIPVLDPLQAALDALLAVPHPEGEGESR